MTKWMMIALAVIVFLPSCEDGGGAPPGVVIDGCDPPDGIRYVIHETDGCGTDVTCYGHDLYSRTYFDWGLVTLVCVWPCADTDEGLQRETIRFSDASGCWEETGAELSDPPARCLE